MGGGAVIAAAAAARRRRIQAIVDAFRLAGATAPDRARTFEELGVNVGDRVTRDLIQDGVLLPVGLEGSWYLSEAGYIAHRKAVARNIRTAVIIVLLLAILIVLGVTMLVQG
jgi:hypothetical protein